MFSVARLLEPFGVELALDVGHPLTEATIAELRALFAKHHLLLFRSQALTLDQQARVVGSLGPCVPVEEDMAYVSNVRPDGGLGRSAISYHSDGEYCEEPLRGLSLHAIQVADDQTSTFYVDGARACRLLAPDLRARVEGRSALHAFGLDIAARNGDRPLDPRWPQKVHPLIMLHPVTGEEILYVTAQNTTRIQGLSSEESEALLQRLFYHLYQPSNRYEHSWRTGDLVIWDNLALQHARGALDDRPRTLQRIGMGKALGPQHPNFATDFPVEHHRLRYGINGGMDASRRTI